MTARGGARASLELALAEIEPTSYAKQLIDRPILMVAATKDEIVPLASTKALYDATDRKPELLWLDAGHITAALHIVKIVNRLAEFHTEK